MLWKKDATGNVVILKRFQHAELVTGGDSHIWARMAAGKTRVKTLTDHSHLGFKITRASLMN